MFILKTKTMKDKQHLIDRLRHEINGAKDHISVLMKHNIIINEKMANILDDFEELVALENNK